VGDPTFPPVIHVFMGDPAQGQAFLDAHTPPRRRGTARGIADPDQVLYRAFAVPRGGWREMFGLRSWIAGARAVSRGKFIGSKVGDGWTLPVWVVLDGDRVTWRWVGTHAGDRPDLAAIPRVSRPS
jgi:hypothetical protein